MHDDPSRKVIKPRLKRTAGKLEKHINLQNRNRKKSFLQPDSWRLVAICFFLLLRFSCNGYATYERMPVDRALRPVGGKTHPLGQVNKGKESGAFVSFLI